MKTLLVTTLTALSLGLGSPLLAATPAKTTMTTCEQLIKQFDDSVGSHGMAAKIKEAKELRTAGENACKSGDYTKGVSDLHTALNNLGVKPAVN